jgi:phosphatidylglycerophosphatase C
MHSNNSIAFFDFDGTITNKDSLLEFIKFTRGKARFYFGFLLNSPWLLAFKFKLISNQRAKERILTHFFGGMPLTVFDEWSARFSREWIPGIVRGKALKEIATLQAAGFRIVIVSASPGNWILPWSEGIGAKLIATELETKPNGLLTGRIRGKNCHGQEKVSRIRAEFRLEEFDPIYTYGDTSGDIPMLKLGNHPFMKPFR